MMRCAWFAAAPLRLLHGAVSALACFGLLNVAVGLLGGRDRNALWVVGQGAPVAGVAAAVVLLAFARFAWPRSLPGARAGHALAAGALALLCLRDAWAYHALREAGTLTGAPLSLSLLLGVLLGWAAWVGPATPPASGWVGRGLRLATAGGAGGVLVLAHLLTFGATDYAPGTSRPADAVVVLGAKVHPDGRPSGALFDRTRTACALYHAGQVRTLVLSGGRGPEAPVSEPEAMARIAREAGVPAEALVLDETGATSDATLATAARLARERGWREVLLVSHDAHLARLALLARAQGLAARTVPAEETVAWRSKPLFVLREVVAFGWHFTRTLACARP